MTRNNAFFSPKWTNLENGKVLPTDTRRIARPERRAELMGNVVAGPEQMFGGYVGRGESS